MDRAEPGLRLGHLRAEEAAGEVGGRPGGHAGGQARTTFRKRVHGTLLQGPLSGNRELPQRPDPANQANGTHHLGAADNVEPARDSALAARPDVVLELEGRML